VRPKTIPASPPPPPPPPGRHPGPNHTLVPTHHTPIAAHLYLHNRRELRASGGTATQPASANYHDIPRGPCELSGGLGQAGAPLHGPPRSVLCPPGGRVVVMQHRLALYTAHTHTHTRAHACTCTHTRCRSSHVQHRGRPCRTHTHTHTHPHTPHTPHTPRRMLASAAGALPARGDLWAQLPGASLHERQGLGVASSSPSWSEPGSTPLHTRARTHMGTAWDAVQ
jgi:hypothetical protein